MARILIVPLVAMLVAVTLLAPAAEANKDAELMLALRGMHPNPRGLKRLALVRHVLTSNPKAIEEAMGKDYGPLATAIQYKDLALVKLLLEHGASANQPSGRNSLVHVAVDVDQTEILELLLAKGAKLHQVDFVHAVHRGSTRAMELLLAAGAKVEVPGETRGQPMQAAAESGKLAALVFLIARGAQVSVPGKARQPLQIAAEYGHVDIARVLLDHAAPIEPKVRRGLLPVELAMLRGHEDVLHLLVNRGATKTPAVQVALGNYYALGRDVDLIGTRLEGETLLHLAARFGHLEVVKLLLAAKVDPRIATPYAGTPLHLAAGRGDVEIVLLLLNAGAPINAATDHGTTALHAAAAAGRRGPLVDLRIPAGHRVTRAKGTVLLLLQRGADVNAALNEGLYVGANWRPLHLALAAEQLDIATALLRAGAKTTWPEKRLQPLSKAQASLLKTAIKRAKR